MGKQISSLAWILFGILLVLYEGLVGTYFPILGWFPYGFVGLICGAIGLVTVLSGEKRE